jgi:hypothetical protein
VKRQDTFNDNNIDRLDPLHPLVVSTVQREVIDRGVNGMTTSERIEVLTKQVCLKCVRMIVICGGTLF